jgi:carbonic anhydrase
VSFTDELLDDNAAVGAGLGHGALLLPPAKRVAVLACMDARLSVDGLLGLGEETPTWSGTPAG